MTEFRNDGVLPVERRFVATPSEFRPELRMVAGSDQPHIAGYGSVYNKLSRNLGGFVERVNPGSFRNVEGQGWPDVVCRYNHNDDYLLGTTKSGTLQLRTDGTGLFYDVVPPSFRSDVLELCQRGDITSSSFAFRVPDGGDDWSHSSDFGGMPLRTLLDLELVDVAPVNTPAYPDATAFARSLEGAVESLAVKFHADPAEIRSLLANKQAVKLFKRSDRPSTPSVQEDEVTDETRAKISTASKNDLPDSDFAYIEPGGTKDESGKTTPRSKRHFPIHDAAHVRNALSRIGAGAKFGKEAMAKVKAAAKKFGVGAGGDDSRDFEDAELVLRAIAEENDLRGVLFEEDDEERAKGQLPPWLQKKTSGSDDQDDDSDSQSDDQDDSDAKAPTKKKPVQKRDDSDNEDDTTSENDDEDEDANDGADQPGTGTAVAGTPAPAKSKTAKRESEDEDDEERAAPDSPDTKEDAAEDEKEKAEAEKEVKDKMAALENKRRLMALMEKRYDPWFFDGE